MTPPTDPAGVPAVDGPVEPFEPPPLTDPTDAMTPGLVDVRLLTVTPRLDGLAEELPPNRARRAVELVAYLALHQPDVITSDRLRTRVLGSSDADAAAKTLQNTAYAARRAMGGDDAGDPLFPSGSRNGLYQLSPKVTVDVHRAATLAAAAKSHADPQLAMAYYRAALDLVEGEPLANALSGYSWWEAEGHGARIAAVLVDAACTLAALAAEAHLFDLAPLGPRARPARRALQRGALPRRHGARGRRGRRRPAPPRMARMPTPRRRARSGQHPLAAHRDALRRAQPPRARLGRLSLSPINHQRRRSRPRTPARRPPTVPPGCP